MRAGRDFALAAAIRELMVVTDPLFDGLLLRGDSPLFCWRRSVVAATGTRMALFVGLVRLRGIRDCVLAEGCGVRV